MCVCVCVLSGGWLTDLAVMILPSSRLIGWEGFVSLFALVNERKEGEPIQYTLSVNRGTLSGGVCVCVCVCVCMLSRVTALSLTSYLRLISSWPLSKHTANCGGI